MQQDAFRSEFQRMYAFPPPEPLMEWIFLPKQEQEEAFETTGYRPLPAEAILSDSARWPSMPPGFIPFADEGGGDAAGLYHPWRLPDGRIPVLHFLHETGHLQPLASDLRGFMLRQLIFEPVRWWPDRFPGNDDARRRAAARTRRWANRFGIPDRFAGAFSDWNSPNALYGVGARARHLTITTLDPLAPASCLWLVQHDLLARARATAALELLDTG